MASKERLPQQGGSEDQARGHQLKGENSKCATDTDNPHPSIGLSKNNASTDPDLYEYSARKLGNRKRKRLTNQHDRYIQCFVDALETTPDSISFRYDENSTNKELNVVTTCSLSHELLSSGSEVQVKQLLNNDKRGLTLQVQPLLVLDINGILCRRFRKDEDDNVNYNELRMEGSEQIACTLVIPRSDLTEFLKFLSSKFTLAVWTSAKKKTAAKLLKFLFPEEIRENLLFVWGQNRCEYDKANNTFIKPLSKVWNEYPLWNTTNTLLVDDSVEKCGRNLRNTIHPRPITGITSIDERNQQAQREFFQQCSSSFSGQEFSNKNVQKNRLYEFLANQTQISIVDCSDTF